ncbi:MAG: cell division protein FtsL [Thermoleophilia bacterium]|nr:cell division protein FtsL [Thermoleophilia bacterium]
MARAAQNDWGFTEITRKFERDSRSSAGRPASGGRRLALPVFNTVHVGAWLMMVALSLIGLVAMHVVTLQKNMQYNELIRERNTLTAENARLAGEVSALSSPERIGQIASGSLGMVPPGKMEYIYIGTTNSLATYAELEGQVTAGTIPP